jgi:hypothetical protein
VPNLQRETESTPAAVTSEGDDETRENFFDEDAGCAKSGEGRGVSADELSALLEDL